MGYLSQASSSVADFNKCVISFLGRYPSTAAFEPGFLEFGQPGGNLSGLGIGSDGSLSFFLYGRAAGYSFTGSTTGTITGATAHVTLNTSAISPATNTWRRYIISLDLSSGAQFLYAGTINTYTLGSNSFRVWASVDDTDYSPTAFGQGLSSFSGPAGSILPSLNGGSGSLLGTEDITYPGFSLAISGLEFAIPVLAANAAPGYNPKFEMADFMMWTGVSLDTSNSTNRRLFINADLSRPPTSTAISTLGTPVYYFSGGASAWSTNLGSAGAAVKTGTITDFTPGP